MSKRILVTLLFLVLYWFGRSIPIPGIDYGVLKSYASISHAHAGEMGNIMRRLSIFSLDIMPYLSTHIIVMSLIAVVAPLKNIFKNGRMAV